MESVLEIIERVGPSDANVLIVGRARHGQGGGGALAARTCPHRADQPLVAVNVGGFSEGVFESELFGHVKGAFTDAKTDRVGCFELADRGTLFLDEIANIHPPAAGQAAPGAGEPARCSGWGRPRCARWTCGCCRPPTPTWREAVAEGDFREDLLYRLNTVEIHLPPLRERREDILAPGPPLPEQRKAPTYGQEVEGFDDEALDGAAAPPLARERAGAGARRGAGHPHGPGRPHRGGATWGSAAGARPGPRWSRSRWRRRSASSSRRPWSGTRGT